MLAEKLEKLRAITSEQQQRGADKLGGVGSSSDGTIEGVIDMLGKAAAVVQSKEAVPTFEEQTIKPDSGVDYLTEVRLAAIPVSYEANAAGGETLIIGGGINVG